MPSGTPSPCFPPFPERLPLLRPDRDPATARGEDRFLDAVQGNILKGHGRDCLRLAFFRFGEPARGADFLRALAAPGPDGRRRVTSALAQMEQRARRHEAWRAEGRRLAPDQTAGRAAPPPRHHLPPAGAPPFLGLMLTRAGLQRLGTSVADPFFNTGMRRGLSESTGPDEMGAAPYDAEATGRDFHGVLLLAGDAPAGLAAHLAELTAWSRPFGVGFLPEFEEGFVWREPHAPGAPGPYGNGHFPSREAFGFADGISQPCFFASERASRPEQPDRPAAWAWTDLRLDQVFVRDGGHAGGSFAALLKLEQKVATFRRYEAVVARLIRKEFAVPAATAAYLAPAVLMGRTRQGYPLGEVLGRLTPDEPGLRALFPAGPAAPDPHDPAAGPPPLPPWLNEFEFSAAAPGAAGANHLPGRGGCPFHVHLRKMNPRTADSNHGTRQDFIGAQPVRRGVVFDPAGRLARREANPGAAWPDRGTGLLFLAYMRDLGAQFEMPLAAWAPDRTFPFAGAADPVLDAPATGLNFGRLALPPMPRVVKRLGGVYLYVPSLPWLQRGGA